MSVYLQGRVSATTFKATCSCSKTFAIPRQGRVPLRITRVCAASRSTLGSSFESIFDDLDQEMSAFQRQVEQEIKGAYQQARNLQEKIDRETAVPEGSWRMQRSEGMDSRGRSFYVEVTTFGPVQTRPAALGLAPSVPLLFGLAVLCGAYFSAVATFMRNYHLTSFAENKRLLLAVTGPLLAAVSPRFRRQWLAALRGERVPLKEMDSA
ncbi:hypothetical protein WJX81_004190 [Elliptochloris bilobata]|uniref:Uncharacterized protein n=1 Tax=Elliptochloris bilobata TaxID=381761 RepID=A0AAW1S6I7_9CHLO